MWQQAFKGEGKRGIWARKSVRGRKERINACRETIVFIKPPPTLICKDKLTVKCLAVKWYPIKNIHMKFVFHFLAFIQKDKVLWRMKDNCNEICRVCQTNLKIEYGNTKSCISLFKPSLKSDTFGNVWAGRLREVVGINENNFPGFSQLACSVCARENKTVVSKWNSFPDVLDWSKFKTLSLWRLEKNRTAKVLVLVMAIKENSLQFGRQG